MPRDDDRVDSAADEEISGDFAAARLQCRDEIVEDPVGDGLVERALVAVAPEVELEALELHAELAGHVADADGREVRLPRHRAEAGELRRLEADLVLAIRLRIGKGLELLGRLRRHPGILTATAFPRHKTPGSPSRCADRSRRCAAWTRRR